MALTKKGCAALLLIGAVCIAPHARALAQDVIAYLAEVGGEVGVTRAETGDAEPGSVGMFLDSGDTVRTGEGGYASVVFQDDGSRVKLGSNAQLTLNASRSGDRLDKSGFLQVGRLWAKITRKKGSSFQIRTPTSVASVKGTRFILEETRPGTARLWVLEDEVLFGNGSEEKTVKEGQKGTATASSIVVEEIESEDLPLEPGRHELIFYLRKGAEQKELHIDLEKK
jgi:hypothetical protein